MSVPFNTIPRNMRVPLFYAEMDNSAANTASAVQRTLLIGMKLAAGSALTGVPALLNNIGTVWSLFGRGSMLANMYERYLLSDPLAEVWGMAAVEPTGAAATGTITLAGTITAAGALAVYIDGKRVQIGVATTDTVATLATALAAAINANADLPVTATAATGVVTLTARWKGLSGNEIPLVANYYGQAGGEVLPGALTCTIVGMASGAGAPDLAPVITGMGDDEYDFIVMPFSDSASLNVLQTELNDSAGRWSYLRQIYGHVYCAARGTVSALVTLGSARNDPHCTLAGYETDVQAAPWGYAAAYAARNAVFIKADPARPTQSGELVGVLPARPGKRFIVSERQTLLNNGIATSVTNGGVARVERAITTYQRNGWGSPDNSYLDSETLHLSAAVLRRLKGVVTSKYGRHKLADDGTRFGAGAPIVTPAIFRGELLSEYAKMEAEGWVENARQFSANLIVERNASDPSRLDVLYPPDYINGLRVVAVLNQFRLQYQ
ncbi:phage tail sheath subtilisin-like domain-containing protein [Crenobacter caeni]|uniref:Phage tail protein n=1 Tax=Crenobacter caeni TaxID=2705474 RepID=A0A6B2KND2_9NEIS|nr:phage tail sheath subtilisin-like domain-containing protein [Crenobacter caeni]NDV11674.1 phage tail protein [Crenobacter caeni]